MDGYISKPVHIPELMEAIYQIVPQGGGPKNENIPKDTSPAVTEAVIDLADLLKHFNGDFAWFKQIFELFVEKSPKDIEAIRKAILNNDGKGLQKTAHHFKSSVSLFRVSSLIDLVITLESMGREEKLQEAKPTLFKLESSMSEFVKAVNNILQKDESCVGSIN